MKTAKHEWRKHEKAVYIAKLQPEVIEVPKFKFITISGEGNPNSDHFAEYIMTLYSMAYGMKMTAKKKGLEPDGRYDYTVYPLEGVWDVNDESVSFREMENFAQSQGLERLSKVHREIYLSDFRKTSPEKLKTVLRFKLK